MRIEQAAAKVTQQLERLAGLPVLEVKRDLEAGKARGEVPVPDLLVRTPEKQFVVEYKATASTESVGAAIRVLKAYCSICDPALIPLIVVPYMGSAGQRLCEGSGVSWLDLSGNAWIHAPGLHITVEGHPNQYAQRGRPKNLFAPKASRIARALLIESDSALTQQDLVQLTGLTKGYVSKVVSRMEEAGLVQRTDQGEIRVRDPDLLLKVWSEAYKFGDHEIHKGHLAIRSALDGLRGIAEALDGSGIQYAATGLAAAWLYAPMASFRLITVYVSRFPERGILNQLGYRDVDAGANVWLVEPNDAGVFDWREKRDDVWCVSPLQVYLDLRGHPERSSEAAEALRQQFLTRAWHG